MSKIPKKVIKELKWLYFLTEFQPWKARILARRVYNDNRKEPASLSNSQISEVSGIPLDQVIALGFKNEWDDVPLGDIINFLEACNIDPFTSRSRWIARQTIKQNKLMFLQEAPHFNDEIVPILKKAHSEKWI